MRVAFAALLVVHGLIHVLGAAKAFGWAALPQLTQPLSPVLGVLWLLSMAIFMAAAAALFFWPRGWWMVGAAAVVISMIAIGASWADAKAGALANGVVLIGV